MNRVLVVLLLAPLAACGGDKSPTNASPTTTGVNVTLSSPLRMGQTAQATGTETLSNGQSRPITSGWQSDATSVASVNNAGVVTGIANGRASIYVVAGGRQGQQLLRVVPDYQGRWTGGLRTTSCTETGIFADLDFCDDYPVGTTYRFALGLTQAGELMTAVVDYDPPYVFPSIGAPIAEDGTSAFSPTLNITESGITVAITEECKINSPRVDVLNGTVNELWRLPNFTGEARVNQDIVLASRTALAASASAGERTASRLRLLRKLAQRLR